MFTAVCVGSAYHTSAFIYTKLRDGNTYVSTWRYPLSKAALTMSRVAPGVGDLRVPMATAGMQAPVFRLSVLLLRM